MGFAELGNFLGVHRKAKVGAHQSYGVTALGKEKAEKFALEGPPWKVLAYIAEDGPSSVLEIVRKTDMNDEKVKTILRGLIRNGYVVTVSQND